MLPNEHGVAPISIESGASYLQTETPATVPAVGSRASCSSPGVSRRMRGNLSPEAAPSSTTTAAKTAGAANPDMVLIPLSR